VSPVFYLQAGGASGVSKVLLIVGDSDGYGPMYSFAGLPSSLPKKAGTFELTSLGGCDPTQAALGFALGAYAFDTYKGTSKPSSETSDNKFATIVWPEGADRSYVQKTSEATFLVRDLISTPSEDMGPNALQAAAEALAALHSGATVSSIVGDDLLKENYPQIHAVGRAAGDKHAPRLIEIRWGKGKGGKKVAIVGKGVTFDTGGLDIKPASAMGKMKKDMGGAAEVLGVSSAPSLEKNRKPPTPHKGALPKVLAIRQFHSKWPASD
jgi:leucyl aminopeptidase